MKNPLNKHTVCNSSGNSEHYMNEESDYPLITSSNCGDYTKLFKKQIKCEEQPAIVRDNEGRLFRCKPGSALMKSSSHTIISPHSLCKHFRQDGFNGPPEQNDVLNQENASTSNSHSASVERDVSKNSDPLEHNLCNLRQFIVHNDLTKLVKGKDVFDTIKVLSCCCLAISTPTVREPNQKQYIPVRVSRDKTSSKTYETSVQSLQSFSAPIQSKETNQKTFARKKKPSLHHATVISKQSTRPTSPGPSIKPFRTQEIPSIEPGGFKERNVKEKECCDDTVYVLESLFHRIKSDGTSNCATTNQVSNYETTEETPVNHGFYCDSDGDGTHSIHDVTDNGEIQTERSIENEILLNENLKKEQECCVFKNNDEPARETNSKLNQKLETARTVINSEQNDMSQNGKSFHNDNDRMGTDKWDKCCESLQQKDIAPKVEETLVKIIKTEPSAESHENEQEDEVVIISDNDDYDDWDELSIINCSSFSDLTVSAEEMEDEQINIRKENNSELEKENNNRNMHPRPAGPSPHSMITRTTLNQTREMGEISPHIRKTSSVLNQELSSGNLNTCNREDRTLLKDKIWSSSQNTKPFCGQTRKSTEEPGYSRTSSLPHTSTMESSGSGMDFVTPTGSNIRSYNTTRQLLLGLCNHYLVSGLCQQRKCYYLHKVPEMLGMNQHSLLNFIEHANSRRFWHMLKCAFCALVQFFKTNYRLSRFKLWSGILQMLISKNISHVMALNYMLSYMIRDKDITSVYFIFSFILQYNVLRQSLFLLQRVVNIAGIKLPVALIQKGLFQLNQSRSSTECFNMFKILKCMLQSFDNFPVHDASLVHSCADRLDSFGMSEEAKYLRYNASKFSDPGMTITGPQYSHLINDSRCLSANMETIDRNVAWPQQHLPGQPYSDLREVLERRHSITDKNGRHNVTLEVSLPVGMQNTTLGNRYVTVVPQKVVPKSHFENFESNRTVWPTTIVPQDVARQRDQGVIFDKWGQYINSPSSRTRSGKRYGVSNTNMLPVKRRMISDTS